MEDVIALSSDEEGNEKSPQKMSVVSSSVESPSSAELFEMKQKQELRIQKLSDALQKIQKLIQKSEEAEVDFEDESNSSYLVTEAYKVRAIKIYEKLGELTGRKTVKKATFEGTRYKEFNQKLQKLVNDENEFPDFSDVKRILDVCDKEYNYQLSATSRRDVALDAFAQIGNLLQSQRKRDLIEMVRYYTSNSNDPAHEDPELESKLKYNDRLYGKRLDDVIEQFCRRQIVESEIKNEASSPRNNKEELNSLTNSFASIETNSSAQMLQQQQQQTVVDDIDDDDVVMLDNDVGVIDLTE